jgi:hypothetical protein
MMMTGMPGRRLLLDALQELEPVHDRHVDVEQDEVDTLFLPSLSRASSRSWR